MISEYPISQKEAVGSVNSISTVVKTFSFDDKILIIVTQEGRLAQWLQVPLASSNPNHTEHFLPDADGDNLPMHHLTPNTLLGGANADRELQGQLYAAQIASALSLKNPEEKRTLLLGLGLKGVNTSREAFFDLVDLVVGCL